MVRIIALILFVVGFAGGPAWARPLDVDQDEEGQLLVLKAFRDLASERYGLNIPDNSQILTDQLSRELRGKLLAAAVAKAGFSMDETMIKLADPGRDHDREGRLDQLSRLNPLLRPGQFSREDWLNSPDRLMHLGTGPNRHLFGELVDNFLDYIFSDFSGDVPVECSTPSGCQKLLESGPPERMQKIVETGLSPATFTRLYFFKHHRRFFSRADDLLLKSQLGEAGERAKWFRIALEIYAMAEEYGFTELAAVRRLLMEFRGINVPARGADQKAARERAREKAKQLVRNNNFGPHGSPYYPLEYAVCRYLGGYGVSMTPAPLVALYMEKALSESEDNEMARLANLVDNYHKIDPAAIFLQLTWKLSRPLFSQDEKRKEELLRLRREAREKMRASNWPEAFVKGGGFQNPSENLVFYCLSYEVSMQSFKAELILEIKGQQRVEPLFDLLKPGSAFIGTGKGNWGESYPDLYLYVDTADFYKSKIIKIRLSQAGDSVLKYPEGIRHTTKVSWFPYSDYPMVTTGSYKNDWQAKFKIDKGQLIALISNEEQRKKNKVREFKFRPTTVYTLESLGFKVKPPAPAKPEGIAEETLGTAPTKPGAGRPESDKTVKLERRSDPSPQVEVPEVKPRQPKPKTDDLSPRMSELRMKSESEPPVEPGQPEPRMYNVERIAKPESRTGQLKPQSQEEFDKQKKAFQKLNAAMRKDQEARDRPAAPEAGNVPSEQERYYRHIRDIISHNWIMPVAGEGRDPKEFSGAVSVTIETDGRLSNLSLSQSSGWPKFDASLLKAVEKSSPLPPLPAVFGNQPLKIQLNFSPLEQMSLPRPLAQATETEALEAPAAEAVAPGVKVRDLKLEGRKVFLKLDLAASGVAVVVGLRLDNLGGRSALWRSDGRQAGAGPILVSRQGTRLTDGTRPMAERIMPEGLELDLELEDDGSFVEAGASFRLTVFLADGRRITGLVKAPEAK